MTTETDLIAALLAAPGDASQRLVYADLLAEDGRTEEESEMREEAATVLAWAGGESKPVIAMTFADVEATPRERRSDVANAWERRWVKLLLRATSAEAGGTDGIHIEVESGCGWNKKRATCNVRGWYLRSDSKKSFPIDKTGGFSVHKVVAFAASCQRRSEEQTAHDLKVNRERASMAGKADELCEEFGVSKYGQESVSAAKYGERVEVAFARSPDEMRRLMRCLKDNGFLIEKTADE